MCGPTVYTVAKWLTYVFSSIRFAFCECGLSSQTNSGCIIEGGLLTQVQTHAMETLGPINLAVL